MKKVGIITYHFALNYGAVLQCFALQKYLQEKKYEVVILNFVSEIQDQNNNIIKKNKGAKGIIYNFLLLPFYKLRKEKKDKFTKFSNNYLNLTKRVRTIKQLKELILEENIDFLISGSDQVFNPLIEDFNSAFLFPFETGAKKISYAASLGNAKEKDIEKIKNLLNDFFRISLREKSDKKRLERLIKNRVEVVCDPVLLLSSTQWKQISLQSDFILPKGKFIVAYFLHKDLFKKEFKLLKKFSKEKKLNLIIINARFSMFSLVKGTKFNVGPLDFVKLILNSEYVFTDSFHGVVFSTIFNKKFVCFDSEKNKYDSRRSDFLKNLGLSDRLYLINQKKEVFKDINYKDVNLKLRKIKEESQQFLECIDEK